jgi:hypothetical protein
LSKMIKLRSIEKIRTGGTEYMKTLDYQYNISAYATAS